MPKPHGLVSVVPASPLNIVMVGVSGGGGDAADNWSWSDGTSAILLANGTDQLLLAE